MVRKKATKPPKPFDGFPLTAHPNGQWCKKIRGKLHYFGPWADWQGALDLFQEHRNDLYAGRTPRRNNDDPTLANLMDSFLGSKQLLVASKEISSRSFQDYVRTCDKIADSIGTRQLLSDLATEDFQKLRGDLANGHSPTTLKGDLGRVRMVFNYAYDSGLTEIPIRYGKTLKTPPARIFRKLANERGARMFSREEILKMVMEAGVQMRAMIYLGINCAFGNDDCGTLPRGGLDLDRGWHTYARPKTYNPRRCPLWPETVDALTEVIATRGTPQSEADSEIVFITKYGNRWSNADRNRCNPISYEFRKFTKRLGFYRKNVTTFYSLRRTFETIGASSGDQVAVDFIMGHVAASDDMSAVYRQRIYDAPLQKVTNHVRDWLLGIKSIE
jgi:integrase